MAAGALVSASAAYAFYTQRSLGKMLTRREHGKICDVKNARIDVSLKKIEDVLDQHILDTREHRERVNNSLHSIALKVAVIETKVEMKNEHSNRDRASTNLQPG